jgi:UDP-N-acetylmuramoyl-tripeptide--D-alanyl-D-alanine ligase
MFSVGELIRHLTNSSHFSDGRKIPLVEVDSRNAIHGSMFVAAKGEMADGHDYIQKAFKNGATIALICEDVSDRPELADIPIIDLREGESALENINNVIEFPFMIRVEDSIKALQSFAKAHIASFPALHIIGITGSVGKSSTKELLAEVLRQRYNVHKNKGNYNSEIGLPITGLELAEGHEVAIFEMGFYVPGDIDFLCSIAPPQIGIVTNIGMVHAERAGSQAEIAKGKAELVCNLPENGFAILNYDDPLVRDMAKETQAKVIFYGFTSQADIYADQIEGLGLEGMRFVMHYQNESMTIHLPVLGRHSVQTALSAAAVGFALGLSWQEIVKGLSYGHTQLRLIAVRSHTGALLIDDSYNASPQSTMAALNLLEQVNGNKIAVLGDMLELGIYEEDSHWKIGMKAGLVADTLLTIGQRAKRIAEAAGQNGLSQDKIYCFDTPEEATAFLRENLTTQDVVLVKGSYGMKMWTIIPALEKSEVGL